ncbi:MAG: hypothetical protein PHQ35_10320 [Phycisphaerae bacterium]|nr:hypothetical protein [Phycisphaerae bacterium]MDD5382005.1 hypothetical protein [Phycisphaerae bacterium]
MSQNEIPNLDELLNSFLDGELDQRHQTEVQRLIDHDNKIAERLQALRNCKRLVNSLPYAEAPDGMLENIKAKLQEKETPVPAAPSSTHRQRQGARHLFVRRLTAATAMFGLVAVFAAVIYSILAPQAVDTQVAFEQPVKIQPREAAIVEKPVKFTARLELKTGSLPEVAAFLNKAIEFNIPSGEFVAASPDKLQDSHVLACNRQNLKVLLDDLGTIWDKLDSATLIIDTGRPQGQIVVSAIAPEQIIEIAAQKDSQSQIKTAQFFAAMNNMAELTPGKEVMVAINDSAPRLMTIPKPVLTSNDKPAVKPSAQTEDSQKINLTITVVE